jgi:hypothetical protein
MEKTIQHATEWIVHWYFTWLAFLASIGLADTTDSMTKLSASFRKDGATGTRRKHVPNRWL